MKMTSTIRIEVTGREDLDGGMGETDMDILGIGMGGILMRDMGMDIVIGLEMRRKADMVGIGVMEVSIRET